MDLPDAASDGNRHRSMCICGICVFCADPEHGAFEKNVTKLLKFIANQKRMRYTSPCSIKNEGPKEFGHAVLDRREENEQIWEETGDSIDG